VIQDLVKEIQKAPCPSNWLEMAEFIHSVLPTTGFQSKQEQMEFVEQIRLQGMTNDRLPHHNQESIPQSLWSDGKSFNLWYPEYPIHDVLTFTYGVDLNLFQDACRTLISSGRAEVALDLISVFACGIQYRDTNSESWSLIDLIVSLTSEVFHDCEINPASINKSLITPYYFDDEMNYLELNLHDRVNQFTFAMNLLSGLPVDSPNLNADVFNALMILDQAEPEFSQYVNSVESDEIIYELQDTIESVINYLEFSNLSSPSITQILLNFLERGVGGLLDAELEKNKTKWMQSIKKKQAILSER
jgi:hypothetical protein